MFNYIYVYAMHATVCIYVIVYATHSSVSGYISVGEGVTWQTMFVRLPC